MDARTAERLKNLLDGRLTEADRAGTEVAGIKTQGTSLTVTPKTGRLEHNEPTARVPDAVESGDVLDLQGLMALDQRSLRLVWGGLPNNVERGVLQIVSEALLVGRMQ